MLIKTTIFIKNKEGKFTNLLHVDITDDDIRQIAISKMSKPTWLDLEEDGGESTIGDFSIDSVTT